MVRLVIAAVLGLLVAVGASLALVSTQAPEDIAQSQSILTSYGER